MLTYESTALLLRPPVRHDKAMLDANARMILKLEWLLALPGITPALLVKRTGAKSPSAVAEWRRTGRIAKQHLPLLADLSGTTDRWWLFPDAPIPPTAEWMAVAGPLDRPSRLGAGTPVVGEVKAGPDGYLEEYGYSVGAADKLIDWPTVDPNAYALRVRGDSMAPRYEAGEYILVEPNRVAEPGDIVIVKLRDGRKLLKKYLYRRNGEVTLASINTEYRPLTVPLAEIEDNGIQFVAGTMSARSLAVREP